MLVNIFKGVIEFTGDADGADSLTADIRNCWRDCKQPLYVLAFALHPKYSATAINIFWLSTLACGSWKEKGNALTATKLAEAAVFYYGKHELSSLPESNLSGLLYSKSEFDDPCDWFKLNKDYYGSLVNFAKFLLDCPVQSASCERLFKDFSHFLFKHQSRLLKEKLVKYTMIKYDLHQTYPQDCKATTGSKP